MQWRIHLPDVVHHLRGCGVSRADGELGPGMERDRFPLVFPSGRGRLQGSVARPRDAPHLVDIGSPVIPPALDYRARPMPLGSVFHTSPWELPVKSLGIRGLPLTMEWECRRRPAAVCTPLCPDTSVCGRRALKPTAHGFKRSAGRCDPGESRAGSAEEASEGGNTKREGQTGRTDPSTLASTASATRRSVQGLCRSCGDPSSC